MIAAIHNQWKKDIRKPHHQSLTGASMTYAGTPDQYYEGEYGNALCEYKFCKFRTLPDIINVGKLLTTKQKAWLNRSHKNGVSVAVGVGYKDTKGKLRVTYLSDPRNWNGKISTSGFSWFDTKEAAQFIVDHVGVSA